MAKTKRGEVVGVRFDEELVVAVDAEVELAKSPGMRVTRSDVVRALLLEALETRARVRNGAGAGAGKRRKA